MTCKDESCRRLHHPMPLILGGLVAGFAAFVLIRSLPEIRRYLRMRRM